MQAFRVLARAAAAVRQPDALVWPREAEDRAAQAAGRLFEEAVPGSDAPMSFEQYTQMTQRHMRHKARLDHFVAEFNKSPRKAIAGLQLPPPEVAKLLLSPNLSAQVRGVVSHSEGTRGQGQRTSWKENAAKHPLRRRTTYCF